jgi:hypothetical protein
MKVGVSLSDLAKEIERQAASKRDFIADTRSITMGVDGKVNLMGAGTTFPVTQLAHRQIAERVGIPAKYYDRMLAEQPSLLATNVNTWFAKEPKRQMVRTLDGKLRAFLSDRYRPLENVDVAEAVLPVLLDLNVEVLSCQITETRLYIKAVDRSITRDVPSGRRMGDGSHVFFDTLSPALVISNSEVGMGALSVETAVWTRACTNLAIAAQRSMRKYHVGGKAADLGEQVYAMLSDQTKRVTDAAVWMQVRDIVKGAFDRARFDAYTDEIAGMARQPIEGDPAAVVELAQKHFGWSENERGSVLRHLAQGGDLTRYGLFNAITRTAEDLDDYDRATEFEQMGGKVVELSPNEWQRIAQPVALKAAA